MWMVPGVSQTNSNFSRLNLTTEISWMYRTTWSELGLGGLMMTVLSVLCGGSGWFLCLRQSSGPFFFGYLIQVAQRLIETARSELG